MFRTALHNFKKRLKELPPRTSGSSFFIQGMEDPKVQDLQESDALHHRLQLEVPVWNSAYGANKLESRK